MDSSAPRAGTPNLRILIAPSGFKECLLPAEVAAHMAAGAHDAAPAAEILSAPMIDGGEGFTEDVVGTFGGTLVPVPVTGPLGEPRMASLGMLGGRRRGTAVVSVSSVAGLSLIPPRQRDPTRTTSYGLGQLIRHALDLGARRILVGCGDSGVHDGGAGAAAALGVVLLDRDGRPLPPGGGALSDLARIMLGDRDPRLAATTIDVFVNARVGLVGPSGATRLFAAQKGADAAATARLEQGLATWGAMVRRHAGIDIENLPGAGASGAVGGGLAGLLGARLVSRERLIDRLSPLPRLLPTADLVLTAEGCIDANSVAGKVPVAVARRAKRYGLPVIALAGRLGAGAERVLDHGIDAYVSILDRPRSRREAIADAPRLLRNATAQVVRLAMLGPRSPAPRIAFVDESAEPN